MEDFDAELERLLNELDGLGTQQETGKPIVVPECDSSRELLEFVDQLDDKFATKPEVVILRFVGFHQMNPDPTLLVHETLLHRSPETKLITEAWSPLLGGSVLIWLAGDCRRIRPTSWLYLWSSRAKRRSPLPWECAEDWRSVNPEPSFSEVDYKTVLRLISKHIPLKAFTDRVITSALLNEFCLLDNEALSGTKQSEATLTHIPSASQRRGSKRQNRSKRVWFIERDEAGRFTLKGGWSAAIMKKDPSLSRMELGLSFATKKALLAHLDALNFCRENNAVVFDGKQMVRR